MRKKDSKRKTQRTEIESVDACDAIWKTLMKRMNNSLMSSRSVMEKETLLTSALVSGKGMWRVPRVWFGGWWETVKINMTNWQFN